MPWASAIAWGRKGPFREYLRLDLTKNRLYVSKMMYIRRFYVLILIEDGRTD